MLLPQPKVTKVTFSATVCVLCDDVHIIISNVSVRSLLMTIVFIHSIKTAENIIDFVRMQRRPCEIRQICLWFFWCCVANKWIVHQFSTYRMGEDGSWADWMLAVEKWRKNQVRIDVCNHHHRVSDTTSVEMTKHKRKSVLFREIGARSMFNTKINYSAYTFGLCLLFLSVVVVIEKTSINANQLL